MMKSVFLFSVGFLVLISSCHEEKKGELCLNENLHHSFLPSTTDLFLDSIYNELESSDSLKTINQIVSLRLSDNSRISHYSFYLIDQLKTRYPCSFQNFRIPGFYIFNDKPVFIRKNGTIFFNQEVVLADSLLNELSKNLEADSLEYFKVYFGWEKGTSKQLVSQTLESVFSGLNRKRNQETQILYGKDFCQLDSTELLRLGPNKYCLTFDKINTPPPPACKGDEYRLDTIDLGELHFD